MKIITNLKPFTMKDHKKFKTLANIFNTADNYLAIYLIMLSETFRLLFKISFKIW